MVAAVSLSSMLAHRLLLSLFLLAAVGPAIADDDDVLKPKTPSTAHYWTNSSLEDFVYPELSDTAFGMPVLKAKPSFGVCVSGGGYRATTVAYGWIRALNQLGYLKQARYLASNSGGSWFNGAFSYTQVINSVFFGPYIPPENLTKATISAPPPTGSYARAIADDEIVANAIARGIDDLFDFLTASIGGWSSAVGDAFLSYFGVNHRQSTIAGLGTTGKVHQAVQAVYPDLPLLTGSASNRPFPIILGSVYLSKEPQVFFPFEFTPLYMGVPARYPDTTPPLGDGFVEPLGFNGNLQKANGDSVDGNKTATVKLDFTVPLTTIIGVSSSFVAQGVTPTGGIAQELTGTETFKYWNMINFETSELPFADGGGIDNLAITPLLRRRVARIICAIATVVPPDGADVNSTTWAEGQYDIAGLFGAVPNSEALKRGITGVEVPEFNKMMQVFPEDGWEVLYTAIRTRVEQGQPPFFMAKYTTVRNEAQAVFPYEVQVLWVWNALDTSWEQQLPSETQEWLNTSRNTSRTDLEDAQKQLTTYPYISTYNANYNNELVNLLSNQASYTILRAQGAIDDLLAGRMDTNGN